MKRIHVRVIPNASTDAIVGPDGDGIKVKVRAVPEGGKANRAVLDLLAGKLGCRARDLLIVSGETSRRKVVELPGGADPGDLLH